MFSVPYKNLFLNKATKKVEGSPQLNAACRKTDCVDSIKDSIKIRLSSVNSLRDTFLHEEVIGKDSTFPGPFGIRQCVYLDTTASGKPLKIIEDFIATKVLPYYANTHTSISHTSFVMSTYRHEAREIIRGSVGANSDDIVIFCGSGSTAAIHKLIHGLNIVKESLPVVFVGPFEHHSNLLPWRETGAEVVIVPPTTNGEMDLTFLEQKLKKLKQICPDTKNRSIYGCFSAGSNVTGALTDDVKVTNLLHKYGGLCFWDYAAAGPHIKIHMNPGFDRSTQKDALFFSGHKFLGGPQTPGVLIVKSRVLRNPVPHNAGGGTVFFVTTNRHSYLMDKEESQEGGTPAIIESIRLGAVFALRNLVGISNVVERETFYTRKVLNAWRNIPGLIILGNTTTLRLPIISFVIEHVESGFQLHQNFVVALLNDLFGIQCRGGCMCAGPYAQILLDIDSETAGKYESALSQDCSHVKDVNHNDTAVSPVFHMVYRPGFTRVSLPAEATPEEIDFLIEAVKLIAQFGWKMLVHYSLCPVTGVFQLHSQFSQNYIKKHRPKNFDEVKSLAAKIFSYAERAQVTPSTTNLRPDLDHLRWFMLPSDAQIWLHQPNVKLPRSSCPFIVKNSDKNFSSRSIYAKESIPFQIQVSTMPHELNNCFSNLEHNNSWKELLGKKPESESQDIQLTGFLQRKSTILDMY